MLHTFRSHNVPLRFLAAVAWRGDANLVQQLYNAGARLDVTGVSRGEGPFSPLAWAERKVGVFTKSENCRV